MVKYNSKGEKLYPFNMRKYGHNIELAYNHQWLIGHPIFWATGKQYGILKDASAWAECYRDGRR